MLSFAHVHAASYARQVEAEPAAELVAIWDEEPERGKEAAQRFHVPFVADLDSLLARDDIDGVVVNSPSSMHYEHYMKAAKAHKHIFSEKTFTLTVQQADEVIDAVKEAGIVFVLSLPQRSRPETRMAKVILDEKLLGQITFMRARIAHNAALDNWWKPGNWFRDPERAGGGAFMDLGCHIVDLVRWFMGPPASTVAMMTSLNNTYEVDDNSAALVHFANGSLAVIESSWDQNGGANPIEIYGTNGSMAWGYPGGPFYVTGGGLTPKSIGDVVTRHPWLELKSLPPAGDMPFTQWVNAILHDVPPEITLNDARNLTEMMEGCYRAANEKKEVLFPL